MKIVREHIDEKFIENSDPIHDMGIGIDNPRKFANRTELNRWVFKHLPHILGTEKIPKDIIQDDHYYLRWEYIQIIQKYCEKYFDLENKKYKIDVQPNWEKLKKSLKRKGFKTKNINEKFAEHSDPIHDMGIGMVEIIAQYMKKNIPNYYKDKKSWLVKCLESKKYKWAIYLIEHGWNVHYWNDYALRYAVEFDIPHVTEILLKHGADINALKNSLKVRTYSGGPMSTEMKNILRKYRKLAK